MANKKNKPELSNCYIIDVGPTVYNIKSALDEAVEDEDYEHAAMCKELLDVYCTEGITYNEITDKQTIILKKYNKL